MQANDVAKALKSWLAIYISEKEYANEPQKYQTGGRIHTDDPDGKGEKPAHPCAGGFQSGF